MSKTSGSLLQCPLRHCWTVETPVLVVEDLIRDLLARRHHAEREIVLDEHWSFEAADIAAIISVRRRRWTGFFRQDHGRGREHQNDPQHRESV